MLVKKLPSGKASGYDGIDTEHIKYGGKMMVTIITKLFNRALEQAIFPKVFKFGQLIPISKPGKSDYTNKHNSCGITLLTTIEKIYEKVIKSRIIDDFERKGVPVTSKMQGVGNKNISYLHRNFLLRETTIHFTNDSGNAVHVACLDIEKAFNKIWQNGLLYKLYKKKINTTLRKIIIESFRDFKLCISLHEHNSEWFTVGQGVHQGGPLSSLLFQIFFDDLINELQHCGHGVPNL